MTQILEDLEKVLDVLDVKGQFILVGHSFGGAIATEYAIAHADRIERLVLIATAGEFRLNPIYRLGLKLPLPLIRIIAPVVRGQLGAPPHVLQAWYANNLSKWNGWSLFRSLTMPVLLLRGHSDRVFSKPLFDEVTRAIPSCEEVNVGASAHMVMLERREAVNRAIERFLEETKRTWRETDQTGEDSNRAALLHHRPWLAHYENGVPFTIAIPRVPVQQLLHSATRRFPSHPALIFEGKTISYRKLGQDSNRFANALIALGIQKSDRVMLLLPNLPQLVIAFFGSLKAGAIAVFTFPKTAQEEVVRQIRDSEAKVLVTLDQYSNLVMEIKASTQDECCLEHVIFVNPLDYLPVIKRLVIALSPDKKKKYNHKFSPEDGLYTFGQLLKNQKNADPNVEMTADDLATIQYTGGTTAAPKGVMLSHYNLVSNALQTRHWMPDSQEGQERFLCTLPFSHSYGLTTALVVPVGLGATMLLKATFDVRDVLKYIRRYRPTIFPGVPAMYVAINDYPGVRRFGLDSIKACISGSAPLPVEVQEAFEKLTRGRLVEGYGLTEASPVTHANPLNGLRKVGSIGIPLPSTEAKIISLVRGKTNMPSGQIGELAVRGPQVMKGYWKNHEETQRTITADGWLLTGDVAQMDDEGYFRIIARKVDMWYPSKPGKPAFPRDVEEVLYEVPQVKEAVVIAVAGQPVAFIIARKERPSAEALIAYCKRRLPPELVPRLVIYLDDFPRTFIGKVLRRELARRVEDSRY
jgi:long-chain acyl-CoA synthetase